MDISRYQIEISRHALLRAIQRKISPVAIEATIKGGKITRFGKNLIKLERNFKNYRLVCIGEVKTFTIKIITVEKK